MTMRILLCDDEPLLRATLSDDLEDAGYKVELANSGAEALTRMQQIHLDIIITDLTMPDVTGMEVLAAAKSKNIPVIMITGHGSVSIAVEAIRAGAFDFLEKPFLGSTLVRIVDRIRDLKSQQAKESEAPDIAEGFSRVIGGNSIKFRQLLETAKKAAASNASLLIIGESGSGKEVLSKAIHESGPRRNKPFVPVSCGAIAPTLLDDELFGHEKGAFTDAKTARAGRFEEAEGGTLFLDDIDDMRLDTQVKLLRVLQDREIRRIGATESIRTDIRIIAASKVDLEEHVKAGAFRMDLLYRLQVLRLDIPPLRERSEDIPQLLDYFISKHASYPVPRLSERVKTLASGYSWPGNIRQLENSVCRALALLKPGEEIKAEDLLPGEYTLDQSDDMSLASVVRNAEKQHITRVLGICGGNRTKTAALLEISRKNLWEKMRIYNIESE